MRRINSLTTAVAVLGVGAMLPSTASAALTTFGQAFKRGNTPVGSVVFDKASGILGVSGGASGVPINFIYSVANGYGPSDTPINSVFRFSATVVGPATIVGSAFDVSFTNINFSFTSVTPGPFGATNLLSGTFASGTLTGTVNGGTATFNSSVSQAAPGDPGVVGYTSDFLDFSNSATQKIASEQFALALSAVNTSSGNGPRFDTSNNMNSFTSDPTGTFSSDPVPPSLSPTPAPPGVVSGLVGIAMGGAQFGMMRFRGRRRAKKTEVAA